MHTMSENILDKVKEGKSFMFKAGHTVHKLVYEKENEWYRHETKVNNKADVSYVMHKDLDVLYRLKTKDLKQKPEITFL